MAIDDAEYFDLEHSLTEASRARVEHLMTASGKPAGKVPLYLLTVLSELDGKLEICGVIEQKEIALEWVKAAPPMLTSRTQVYILYKNEICGSMQPASIDRLR